MAGCVKSIVTNTNALYSSMAEGVDKQRGKRLTRPNLAIQFCELLGLGDFALTLLDPLNPRLVLYDLHRVARHALLLNRLDGFQPLPRICRQVIRARCVHTAVPEKISHDFYRDSPR